MTGYVIGCALPDGEPPWPARWESDPRIDDGHPHRWESVLMPAHQSRSPFVDEVVRCTACHAPRCGYVRDVDPCMERRHHHGPHEAFSGEVWPVGGNRR